MLRRIFMQVTRGMTDKTAVCVFPWEKPLVEEVHGGNAIVVSIDELCNQDGVSKVEDIRKVVRLPTRIDQKGVEMKAERGLTMREQLERMATVRPEDNPLDDVAGEWNRMMEKYGMHSEVKLTNVEKVYGSLRMFRLCLRDFAAGRTPEFLKDDSDDDDTITDGGDDDLAVAEMTVAQMKAELERRKIAIPKGAKRPDLESLLTDALAEAA